MNFSKKGTIKKQQQLHSVSQKLFTKLQVGAFRILLIAFVMIIMVSGYAGVGLIRGIIANSPNINSKNIEPEYFSTTVYNEKGKEIYQLVGSDANRIFVSSEEIPDIVKNAFIAIEDERFYTHNGIDVKGIIRVTFAGIATRSFDQGASTITQQLLKNLVFSGGNETTFADKVQRKIQEQYLAIQLENTAQKDTILTNYLNTINLGQNTLGVQAASLRYFNKDVSKLTLSEATVIAGITKNPSDLNPISNPTRNEGRRKDILDKMLSLDMISQDEYEKALQDDVYKRIKKINKQKTAPKNTITSYFVDEVIDQVTTDLQEELGYSSKEAYNLIYRGGLSIYTTQDSKLQKICDDVLSNEAFYPANSSYELTYRLTVVDKNGDKKNYNEQMLQAYFQTTNPTFSLYFKNKSDAKSYVKKYKKHILKKSDVIEGEVTRLTIQPQISFVLMEQASGKVKAIVGGRGKKAASRTLNRATDTNRQPGSTFKIVSAYLPALDTGMTLATVQDDAQYYYPGTNKLVRNWDKSGYKGFTSLRQGIKQSMNVVTVKTLAEVTPEVSYSYLKKLGFSTLVGDKSLPANDINLATALGGLTYGVTNLELTAAYAAIANGGAYTEPLFYTKILDHDGNVLIDKTPKKHQVMKESTAWLLTSAMKDVVTGGTGRLAAFTNSNMPVAGKTGTTTKNIDAWFVGYTPYYTAGIWSGYDNNKIQSDTSYHKVIWRTIMEKVNAKKKRKDFKKPASIVTASICSKSGKLAKKGICDHAAGGSTVRTEYFAGSAPTQTCDVHVKVSVCDASNKPASKYCPVGSIKKKILMLKNESCKTADSPYVISKNYKSSVCDVHSKTTVTDDENEEENTLQDTTPSPEEITTIP